MSNHKILVVDDDRAVSMGVRISLEDKYDVATEDSASGAFSHMARNKVDLVLLDIKMPVMNGISALKEIRKRHPETSVVMLTAYPTDKNMQKSWDAGADGFLTKPFDLDELRKFVDRTLSKKKGH
jgi:DNA-binding response OmpR family regulator